MLTWFSLFPNPCSFIRCFRQLRDSVAWLVSEPMLVYYLHNFRDAYWPDGVLAEALPPRTDEDKLLMRKQAKEKILDNIPGNKNFCSEILQREYWVVGNWYHGLYCRIWSWSPVPCEKHGPRDSVDKNRGPASVFVYWVPRAMFFTRHGRPWSNPIIARSLIDFFLGFIHINMHFSTLNKQFLAQVMVAREIALLLWTGCQGTQMNTCLENLNTCFTGLNVI